jgi:hypothetical protein
MEQFAAALTGALLSLLCWELLWGTQALTARRGGARLLKVVRMNPLLLGWKCHIWRVGVWILRLGLLFMLLVPFLAYEIANPLMTFDVALFAGIFVWLDHRPHRYVQLFEHGMVLSVNGRIALVPYGCIRYCQWARGAPRLLVRMQTTEERCTFRNRDVEAVTGVLASHVEIRFESESLTVGPAVCEAPPRAVSQASDSRLPPRPVYVRFQFTLRTLLLGVLVASAASSWLGIRVRRVGPQKAALAKFDSFKPTVTWMNGDVRLLSFPLSPMPGDDDLEPLEALTGLRYLTLNHANVTDAGMVHLGNLRKLEHVLLSGTRITDAGLVHLHGLKHLKHVIVTNTDVTDQGVADLRRAVPGVVVDH